MPVFHCELPFEFFFGLRLSMLKMLDNSACLPEAAWKSKFNHDPTQPAKHACQPSSLTPGPCPPVHGLPRRPREGKAAAWASCLEKAWPGEAGPGAGPGSWGKGLWVPASLLSWRRPGLEDWPLGNSPEWGWTGVGGSGAGPQGSRPPPSGLEPHLRAVSTGSVEWSAVTDWRCLSSSFRSGKKLLVPRSPNTQPVDLSRQFSWRRFLQCLAGESKGNLGASKPAPVCHHCLRNSYDPNFIG